MSIRALAWPLAGLFAVFAFAHPDDPKVRDRLPQYEGPGFRLSNGKHTLRETFNSRGVQLLSWLTPAEMDPNATTGNSCWGYVSPSGREYAVMGISTGTAFVEITDPTNPVVVRVISGPNSLWRDMKIYQNYAYAISEGGSGIQVMDLTNIDNGTVSLVRTVNNPGTSATHTLALDEVSGFLYRCGGGSEGLRIYSLANPSNPSHVATWSPRYVHEAQAVTYTDGPYAGRQFVFACGGLNGGFVDTAVDIIDVTDKQNIFLVKRMDYTGSEFSHQVWLSPDRKYAYQNDEFDEGNGRTTRMHVFDVESLENGTYVGWFSNGNEAIGHNIYVDDDFVYCSNYRSGLRVFDRRVDAVNPLEFAFFDTFPANDQSFFNGLWSNYPYFPSGVVIGSDIERGLFVWRVYGVQLEFAFPDGLPAQVNPDGQDVRVDITTKNGGELAAGTAYLNYDAGQGWVQAPMTALDSDSFVATFPPVECGTRIVYYFSADAEETGLVTAPAKAPTDTYETYAAVIREVRIDEQFEVADSNWTVGEFGDNASDGYWERVDPIGSLAQPEDDRSLAGTMCWITEQADDTGVTGESDVDDGKITLVSPVFDLSNTSDPRVSYWRWYHTTYAGVQGEDVFQIDISNDFGVNWTNLELVGPTGDQVSGGWYFAAFRVNEVIEPTDAMRLRFVASDFGGQTVVEAAIDDLVVADVICSAGCTGDLDASGAIDLSDLGALLSNYGTTGGATTEQGDIEPDGGDGDVDLGDLGLLLSLYGSACP